MNVNTETHLKSWDLSFHPRTHHHPGTRAFSNSSFHPVKRTCQLHTVLSYPIQVSHNFTEQSLAIKKKFLIFECHRILNFNGRVRARLSRNGCTTRVSEASGMERVGWRRDDATRVPDMPQLKQYIVPHVPSSNALTCKLLIWLYTVHFALFYCVHND